MPIDVLMPQLSPTMTEGRLAKWLKAVGDEVRAGDVMAEVETDKATMEVEAPGDGTIHAIMGQPGEDLMVGVPIAVLAKKGEQVPSDYVPASKAKVQADGSGAAADGGKAAEEKPAGGHVTSVSKKVVKKGFGGDAVAPMGGAVVGGMVELREGHIAATPLARRMADARGLPLGGIAGTGPQGRVTAGDVENAVRVVAVPLVGNLESGISNLEVKPEVKEGDRVEKLSPMRKAIAKRLQASKQTVPHFYLTRSVKMDAAMVWRGAQNKALEAKGVKLSVNDLVIRACALALRDFPAANASWNPGTEAGAGSDSIVLFGKVDLSVAVAIDGGLVTPIVADAANKDLAAISGEMKELAALARAGKLKPHQYEGGSFSISNLGMYGIEEFSAIINPPQAAILAVGATVEGKMKLTLSVDHRVIDGALGAEVLGAIVGYLENPEKMVG